jgi:putative intracellular protease/amidase
VLAAGKVVAAVCHGAAGLLGALGPGCEPIVSGRRVTCFTASEERAAGKERAVPFMLEERLREVGGRFERGAADWGEFALRDGNLVTGQNPASALRVAGLVLEVLSAPAGSMQGQHMAS